MATHLHTKEMLKSLELYLPYPPYVGISLNYYGKSFIFLVTSKDVYTSAFKIFKIVR
jgi:hypothetical protein